MKIEQAGSDPVVFVSDRPRSLASRLLLAQIRLGVRLQEHGVVGLPDLTYGHPDDQVCQFSLIGNQPETTEPQKDECGGECPSLVAIY